MYYYKLLSKGKLNKNKKKLCHLFTLYQPNVIKDSLINPNCNKIINKINEYDILSTNILCLDSIY